MNYTELATLAALEAGEMLAKGFGTSFPIYVKNQPQDYVTDFDRNSQKIIIDRIKQVFPHHQFLAEEGQPIEQIQDEIIWIIDPLDGTVNFARNIPFFAVSIAAVKQKEVLCGVVYNPMTHELFVAERGAGAFLNGNRIRTSSVDSLEKALIATGFPYDIVHNPLHCIERLASFLHKGIHIRRMGVASVDLAYVAMGRFDAFWEVGLQPWDMAAGKLLVEEGGGVVTLYDGSPHPILGYLPTIASNRSLHKFMVSNLKGDP